ncbi:hypothetical protein GCM10012278_54290 [Nonomuraea glycinis]|uniref:Uncharacterized protein n=1 Tax=Nonomuraea glycinis TaxID=2047744 RepID=A0A918E6T1_9ACTN|nr:hypothetical protein GCM10012278_54290 [Nonomuraea glycinis]
MRSGLSVANPDYRIASEPGPEKPLQEYSIRFTIEPQWARLDAEPASKKAYEAFQTTSGGKLLISPAGAESLEPVFRESRMQELLSKLGAHPPVGSKKATAGLLEGLGRYASVTAIVELGKPMPAAEFDNAKGFGPDNILIASQPGEKPFYWDAYPHCEDRKVVEDCDNVSLFQQFEAWVAGLRTEDAVTLTGLNLRMGYLQDAARRGLIVGYVEVNTSARELRLLLDDSRVGAIHVVDARLNCEVTTAEICDPAPWSEPQVK